MKKVLLLLVGLVWLGCKQPEKEAQTAKANHHYSGPKTIVGKDSARVESEQNQILDSIRQIKLLDTSMKYAVLHTREDGYTKTLQIGEGAEIKSTLWYGHLFSNTEKHLIINTNSNWDVHLKVLLMQNGKFKELINKVIWNENYLSDTTRDVNGDGFKDFITTTYASAGCCLRNRDEVMLFNPQTAEFSDVYVLMNPTYFPKEKIVCGVEYGHPGEVPLYTFKWAEDKIDTIEYIYPADTLRKKFYRVKNRNDYDSPQKRVVLTSVPKRYRNTEAYYWFML